MRAAFHALVGLLLLACAVVALAPATLVDARVAAATSGALRLDQASGTLWQGRATLMDARGTFALPLAWRLDPSSIPTGAVAWRFLPSTDRAPSGEVRYGKGRLLLERFDALVPVALLAMLAKVDDRVALVGDLRVTVPRLDVAPGRYDGTGSIRWSAAVLSIPALPALSLGDVDVALGSSGGAIVGSVANRGGDVGMTGTIVLGPTQASVDLSITPGPRLPAVLGRTLGALGRSEGSATRIQWQGRPLVP